MGNCYARDAAAEDRHPEAASADGSRKVSTRGAIKLPSPVSQGRLVMLGLGTPSNRSQIGPTGCCGISHSSPPGLPQPE